MLEGELGTRRQAKKRRKSDRLLLPEVEVVIIVTCPLAGIWEVTRAMNSR